MTQQNRITVTRREALCRSMFGIGSMPFLSSLPSLGFADSQSINATKKRLIVVFTPNGQVVDHFWPKTTGREFTLSPILEPLAAYQNQMLVMKGIHNRIRGDGDNHMRGMGCLLTGIELFPGNIQGGGNTPAGWAKGISIDQEIKNFLQSNTATRTRFGALEFGVCVPDRANPWTRLCYAGANQPIAPISNPYRMFQRIYGNRQQQQLLGSLMDDMKEDFAKASQMIGKQDRHLLDKHQQFVREMELDLANADQQQNAIVPPEFTPGIKNHNDNMPALSKMQTDLMVNAMVNDHCRVATLQYTRSVGNAKMRWLGIQEGHHSLSHDPDLKEESQKKLVKINRWFAEQIAYLLDQLAAAKDPATGRSLLQDSIVVWTNEMGKGNSHTLNNIPFVIFGGGLDVPMGEFIDFDKGKKKVAHNRLLLSLAHSFGHRIKTFGNRKHCADGPLKRLLNA